MRIARFLNRVKISRAIKTRTDTGASSETIEEVLTCRGGVENVTVGSHLNADKETAVAGFKVVVRTPKDVVIKIDDIVEDLDTNRVFTIVSPPKYSDKNMVLELSCEETE